MTIDYLNKESEKNAEHIALDFSNDLSIIDENLNSQMEILHLYDQLTRHLIKSVVVLDEDRFDVRFK